ncbi:Choline-sulfatase [Polystyrenella longa]|uniref:Choline-sulfatase n=1 Tax=Polystyrenella longa TaxID=2528007 RepID=A0A518CNY7_9PLAN|nr:sulfatase [Polystyrenella longa]QDU80941.1 Choline-sulfatase [Polystyrenella longa]
MRLLVLCFVAVLFTLPSLAKGAEQKNVLFIAVDDLRAQLNCYGDDLVISPHVDRLAAEGTLFERAYCQQTVCNPSRASVMTGLRPDTLRVYDLPTHFRQIRPDAVTLPQSMMQAGYYARDVGKIFHNYRQDEYQGDPTSWSVPAVLHYGTHGKDLPQVEGEIPPDHSSALTQTKSRDVPDYAYYDGQVADAAIKALHEIKELDQPFFFAVGFWKPHLPFNAPKKYWDMYNRENIPVPEHIGHPENVPEIALTKYRIDGSKNNLTTEDLRELHHGHLAAITYMDAQIGRVLTELDSLDMRKNTIIIFWSDHGLHIGEHGLYSKTTLFELDAQVPMIIATPDHPGGQRTDALVELLDIYPTVMELAGLEVPNVLEGKSLVPLLNDPETPGAAAAMTQTPRPNYPRGKTPEVMGYSIRTDTLRYTEWRDHLTGKVIARELYDHEQDPLETVNAIGDDLYADQLPELEKLLEEKVSSAHPPEAKK